MTQSLGQPCEFYLPAARGLGLREVRHAPVHGHGPSLPLPLSESIIFYGGLYERLRYFPQVRTSLDALQRLAAAGDAQRIPFSLALQPQPEAGAVDTPTAASKAEPYHTGRLTVPVGVARIAVSETATPTILANPV